MTNKEFPNLHYDGRANLAVIIDMLQALYNYYPIGCDDGMSQLYPGYKAMKEIVNEKIELHIEDPESDINKLATQLKNALPEALVENHCYFPFPHLLFQVMLANNDHGNFNYSFQIDICISLLANFYTVYFNEQYRFNDPSDGTPLNSMCTILSFDKKSKDAAFITMIERIKEAIEIVYPQKKFVHYKTPSSFTVKGFTPFGEPYYPGFDQVYSLFDYLFYPVDTTRNVIKRSH